MKTYLKLILIKNLDQIKWNQFKESLSVKRVVFKRVLLNYLCEQVLNLITHLFESSHLHLYPVHEPPLYDKTDKDNSGLASSWYFCA